LILFLLGTGGLIKKLYFDNSEKSLKTYEDKEIYWLASDISLGSKDSIEACDNYLKSSEGNLLTFVHLGKDGYVAEMRVPPNSKVWSNGSLENIKSYHGKKVENKLDESVINNNELKIVYTLKDGTQQTFKYVQGEDVNVRYLISAVPGNNALQAVLAESKKNGKLGMREVRCKGPISVDLKADESKVSTIANEKSQHDLIVEWDNEIFVECSANQTALLAYSISNGKDSSDIITGVNRLTEIRKIKQSAGVLTEEKFNQLLTQKNSEIPMGAIVAPHRNVEWFSENCVKKVNEIISTRQ
jgi:hypothetical protein